MAALGERFRPPPERKIPVKLPSSFQENDRIKVILVSTEFDSVLPPNLNEKYAEIKMIILKFNID